ncbi:TIGR04197 family type VII secretion effector [Enterococcus sp. LJL51]|uniref:TIGR04197 family type VII secretion effector n=1 Tax=Enterococcus sp. LJL51 TaxID=3416656 RepID=UPI003CF1374A
MSQMTNNLGVAGAVSQQMSQAASALNSTSSPGALASKTMIAGNRQAQQTIQLSSSIGQRVSNGLARDGNSIHSVSQEFAAIDQQQSKGFDGLSILPGPRKGRF